MSSRSDSKKPTHSPRYEVTVSGDTVKEAGGDVSDLVVESALDGADRFSATLAFRFDWKKQDYEEFDWKTYKSGKKVTVKLGWGEDSELTKVFTGKIQQSQSEFGDRGPVVGVSGYGVLHEMMRGTPDDSWSDTKLKSVVDEKLGSHFGETEVKKAKMKRKKLIQHNKSDYRFVKKLADKYGFQFYTELDKAYFIPRSQMGKGDPVETLNNDQLESFSAERNEANKLKKVEVRFWDMQKEKEVVATASQDANNDKKKVFRIPCESKKEAKDIAENKLGRLSKAKNKVHGETSRGKPKIRAGKVIKLDETGKRFAGKYYVTKATHRVGGSGFRTEFDAKEVPE